MRLALISDIHANLVALEAVVKDIDRERPEKVICLGDVASTGPQPHETIERLRELKYPVVLGNADAWLLDPETASPTSNSPRDADLEAIFEIDGWCAVELCGGDLKYLRSFKPVVEDSLGENVSLLCFHGSPKSNTDVILSTTPEEDLEKMLSGFKSTIMAGGHTHTQMIRRFREMLLVNPGSVGLPAEWLSKDQVRNPPWVEYALIRYEKGQLGVELRRVPVDLSKLLQAARESRMPHADLWMRDWR